MSKPDGIPRRVFRDTIREQLIDDILSGRLPPGTRILETRLAETFGVSHGPVREALRDLELLGFVTWAPFRSTYVRQFSTDDLLQNYPIRAALESLAAREATTRIGDRDLAKLDRLVRSMRSAAAVDDYRAQVEADYAFHQTIINAAGNRMLMRVWEAMRVERTTLVTRWMARVTRRSRMEICERHVPILEALRAGDAVAAGAAMRQHIEEAAESIRGAAASDGQPQPSRRRALGKLRRPRGKPTRAAHQA